MASAPGRIDLSRAHLWDLAGVAAVDKVVFRYRRQGAEVVVTGVTQAETPLVERVGRHDKTPLPSGAGYAEAPSQPVPHMNGGLRRGSGPGR